MRLCLMILFGLSAGWLVMPGAAHADVPTLVDFATVSMSAPGMPRTVTDTVCVTDGRDLTCDRGVYVTSDSRVGIGTNAPVAPLSILANGHFPDLHIRDTLGGAAAQIHFQNNVRTWQLGSDASPDIFFIDLSNGNQALFNLTPSGSMGLGVLNPSTSLNMAGSLRLGSETSSTMQVCDANRTGAIRYTAGDFSFCRNGSSWETLAAVASTSDRIVSGTSSVIINSATGIVSISQFGAVASYVHPSLGYVGPGVSTTGTVSTTRVHLAATPGQCATAADIGSMFRSATTGRLQVCVDRH